MGSLSITDAQLPALFVECIFYGIYITTFFACLQRSLFIKTDGTWQLRRCISVPMLLVIVVLFINSTLNLSLGLVRDIQGFVEHIGPGSIEQLGQDWVNVVKPLTINLQILVADGVLIFRCWVVYNRSRRIIIFPAFCWFGVLACIIYVLYLQIMLTSGSRMTAGDIGKMFISFWSCTIALNIYCTSAIVYRIWKFSQKYATNDSQSNPTGLEPLNRGQIHRTVRIIVESALIYTIMTIIAFATEAAESNWIYITTAAEIQVVGITFNLMLIRVMKGRDMKQKSSIISSIRIVQYDVESVSVNSSRGIEDDKSLGTAPPKLEV